MRLIKALIGGVIGFVVFALLTMLVTWCYYRLMPGNWFLNYYYAHVDNVSIGEDVPLTLCRTTHYQNFKLTATRSFLYQEKNGKYEPVSEYDLHPTIEDRRCQTVQIPAKRQPQTAGTYKLYTEASFYVEGHRKTIKYETNAYKVQDTVKSIEDRIKDLEQQIDELRSQMSQMQQPLVLARPQKPSPTPTTPVPVPVARNNSGNAPTKAPETTAPPDPPSNQEPPYQEPQPPNLLEQLSPLVDNLIQRIL